MDENKSIDQLQSIHISTDAPAGITSRCLQCMRIPIKDLSKEQVRLLLSQDIGTIFLLDKTIQILEEDILADGDFYPGDLLSALLNVSEVYWKSNSDLAGRLYSLLNQQRSLIQKAGHKRLDREVAQFMAGQFSAVN
ncbi:contact-dependent growth inhibition system immunity protein [Terrimonas ginsenosidimutans]|nr:contact-dependent growth inhibition system immunity protein [Terrimonas ginsenosidimutans]